ncbi:MAG: amidohydrolase family protein [Chloroflexota bacterium]|nr:amidohydrolase family protein [Chloroflexota bacterium]
MLVIKATLLETDADHPRLLRDQALRLDKGCIADIGSAADLRERYPDEERLDAQGMLVMPGLICSHTSLHASLPRGISGSSSLVHPTLRPFDTGRCYEELRYRTLLGCIRAIRNGTTTVFDYHFSSHLIPHALDAMAQAILQSGLRGCLSHIAREVDGVAIVQEGIRENARFAQRVANEPLLTASIGLETSGGFSDETLGAFIRAGAFSDTGFSVIVLKTSADDRDSEKRYALGVLSRLRKFGILGPRSLLLGCERMNRYEVDTVLRARSWPVYNPATAAVHRSELAPVAQLLRNGLKVCVGCGRHSGSVFGAMQIAYFLHRRAWDPTRQLNIRQIKQMVFDNNATMASTVFRKRLGGLDVGSVADLILLDRPRIDMLDGGTLFEDLALLVGEIHVDTTIVDGRVLMRHGELLTLDEEAIMARMRGRDCAIPIHPGEKAGQ